MSFIDTDLELSRRSYYAATAPRGPGHAPLAGDRHCDVAVVGGGLAGLSAALELARRGFEVVLLEARQVGWGASGRNGGQAIHGLSCEPAVVERQLGLEDSRRIFAMTIEALDLMRRRIAEHAIDCDWRDGFLALATRPRKAAALMAWADELERRYDYPLRRIPRAELGSWIDSTRYHGGAHDPRSGHLHPLKYSLGLARAAAAAGATLHEHTPVLALRGGPTAALLTGGGTVHARQVLLAGNVYLQGLAPTLEARIMPVGTYIACTVPLDPARARALIPCGAAACDTDFVLDYFRTTADHRMLYGGRVSYSTRTPPDLQASLRERMLRSFPQLADAAIEHTWGGFVDISMNRAPDFGRLPPAGPGAAPVYYLQGFSGHGLALSGLAGLLVAEAMAGDASRFDVFARLRHHPFPGGRRLRTPALVLGMAWHRLRDMLA